MNGGWLSLQEQTTLKGKKPCLLQGNDLLHSPGCFWLGPTWPHPAPELCSFSHRIRWPWKLLIRGKMWPLHVRFPSEEHSNCKFPPLIRGDCSLSSAMLFQQQQVCLLGSFQQFNLFLSSLPSSPKLVPQLCLFSPINRALTQKWPLYDIINALPFAGRILFCF